MAPLENKIITRRTLGVCLDTRLGISPLENIKAARRAYSMRALALALCAAAAAKTVANNQHVRGTRTASCVHRAKASLETRRAARWATLERRDAAAQK